MGRWIRDLLVRLQLAVSSNSVTKLTHGDVFIEEYATPKESGNKGEGLALTVHLSTLLWGDQPVVMGDQEKGNARGQLDGTPEDTAASRTS